MGNGTKTNAVWIISNQLIFGNLSHLTYPILRVNEGEITRISSNWATD